MACYNVFLLATIFFFSGSNVNSFQILWIFFSFIGILDSIQPHVDMINHKWLFNTNLYILQIEGLFVPPLYNNDHRGSRNTSLTHLDLSHQISPYCQRYCYLLSFRSGGDNVAAMLRKTLSFASLALVIKWYTLNSSVSWYSLHLHIYVTAGHQIWIINTLEYILLFLEGNIQFKLDENIWLIKSHICYAPYTWTN